MPIQRSFLRLTQALCLGVLAFAAYSLLSATSDSGTVTVPPIPATPGGSTMQVRPAAPSRLRIPALRIDAPVNPVGINDRGEMVVPVLAGDIGWYALGARPGETGSAVLSGHLDSVLGTRGVFGNLQKLATGDSVYVDNGSGGTLHFRVIASHSYPTDEAPIREIFTATGGQLLNLITCSGTWTWPTYDKRLVVYTQLVDSGK